MTLKPTCERCGDVIGVYEPMIVVVNGEVSESSRALDPSLIDASAERYHRYCYPGRGGPASDSSPG